MATLTVGFTVWYGELRRGELGCPLESLTFSRPCTQLHACISHMLVLLVLPDVPGCWRCFGFSRYAPLSATASLYAYANAPTCMSRPGLNFH